MTNRRTRWLPYVLAMCLSTQTMLAHAASTLISTERTLVAQVIGSGRPKLRLLGMFAAVILGAWIWGIAGAFLTISVALAAISVPIVLSGLFCGVIPKSR